MSLDPNQCNHPMFNISNISNISIQQLFILLNELGKMQRILLEGATVLLENSSTSEQLPVECTLPVVNTTKSEVSGVVVIMGICIAVLSAFFALILYKAFLLEKERDALLKQNKEVKPEPKPEPKPDPKPCPVSSYVQLGNELERVEAFLNKIKNNLTIDGHFLLLDGPPGTGKTSLVLKHLKEQGYPIHEWVRGEGSDRYVNQVIARVGALFQQVKAAARKNSKVLQVIFIDEIEGVIPNIQNDIRRDGIHSFTADNAAFLTEISALAGYPIVLIGATNFPNQLPPTILSRAGVHRIHFPLPNSTQRQQLLTYFFRNKQISSSCIETLANVAIGYSPRELLSFVESIQEHCVGSELMKKYFNRYAETLRADFKAEFGCAEIFMPSFVKEDDLKTEFSLNAALEEQFNRLQYDHPNEPKKHTLLYGPPGGGTTTAVRLFSQRSKQVLISVNAGRDLSKDLLAKIFSRAMQFEHAIIFFDEMDRIAYIDAPLTAFLQTEMDGISANGITIIGATNYREHFEPAILSRFTRKISLSKLDSAALNLPIRKTLLESIQSQQEDIYLDQPLAAEMKEGATKLATESEGLDWRSLNAAIRYLLGDIKREKPSDHVGIIYLRLQDVCFSFYIMKIQEEIPVTMVSPDKTQTTIQYIRENRASFFPTEIPEGSVSGRKLVIMAHQYN